MWQTRLVIICCEFNNDANDGRNGYPKGFVGEIGQGLREWLCMCVQFRTAWTAWTSKITCGNAWSYIYPSFQFSTHATRLFCSSHTHFMGWYRMFSDKHFYTKQIIADGKQVLLHTCTLNIKYIMNVVLGISFLNTSLQFRTYIIYDGLLFHPFRRPYRYTSFIFR